MEPQLYRPYGTGTSTVKPQLYSTVEPQLYRPYGTGTSTVEPQLYRPSTSTVEPQLYRPYGLVLVYISTVVPQLYRPYGLALVCIIYRLYGTGTNMYVYYVMLTAFPLYYLVSLDSLYSIIPLQLDITYHKSVFCS